jgi:hypothetical protein
MNTAQNAKLLTSDSARTHETIEIEWDHEISEELYCLADDSSDDRDAATRTYWGTDAEGWEWQILLTGVPRHIRN